MIPFILLGLLVGEWLVWCADRLPDERGLFTASRCPHCGADISSRPPAERWLIALGWRDCDMARVRWSSLAIMLINAAGFGYLWSHVGLRWELLPYAVYWSIFVLITIIDMRHRLILNEVIYPAILLGIAGALILEEPGIVRALLGGATGFAMVYVIYLLGALFARIMGRMRGQEIDEVAFGAGDVKLAAFIGLVTGLPGVIFALVIGIFAGGIAASLYLFWQAVVRRRYAAFTAIPYGPFLVLGALPMMLYGPTILDWYLAAYR